MQNNPEDLSPCNISDLHEMQIFTAFTFALCILHVETVPNEKL